MGKKDRKKTMSVHYYDDEIIFKDPENGDLHLKEGVKRMNYTSLRADKASSINVYESDAKINKELKERLGTDNIEEGEHGV